MDITEVPSCCKRSQIQIRGVRLWASAPRGRQISTRLSYARTGWKLGTAAIESGASLLMDMKSKFRLRRKGRAARIARPSTEQCNAHTAFAASSITRVER